MQIEKDNRINLKRLSSDDSYYNNVFKKTEKLVSVTFYILSETNSNYKTEFHLNNLKDKAFKAHEVSLKTLSLQGHEVHRGLLELQDALVALGSTLKVSATALVITDDIHTLLADQLDIIQRYLNNHYLSAHGLPLESLVDKLDMASKAERPKSGSGSTPQVTRQRRVKIPAGDISTDAYLVHSQMTDRAERIKTVLEAKPQASVSDIAEVITDVSEKTIQRELNSLIEKGQVIREGERRWSKYSVSK